MGPWLEMAKALGTNEAEKALYEYNARNQVGGHHITYYYVDTSDSWLGMKTSFQITLWGPNGEIMDYAAKQWSGLFSSYYTPRSTFNAHILSAMTLSFGLSFQVDTLLCHPRVEPNGREQHFRRACLQEEVHR